MIDKWKIPMNPFYEIIKNDCKNYSDDDKRCWIKDENIYCDWDESYEMIRKWLDMTLDEFDFYIENEKDDFDDDYRMFTDAEQIILKEIKKELFEQN